MTEEEAKKKWCPMVRLVACETDSTVISAHQGFNRVFISDEDGSTKNPEMSRCIAPDCMMWIQAGSYWAKAGVRATLPEMETYKTPEEGGFITITEGYCGLAGKP